MPPRREILMTHSPSFDKDITRPSGSRSVQRLHFRRRKDLATDPGGRRGEQLCPAYGPDPGYGAQIERAGLLCHALPLSAGRL